MIDSVNKLVVRLENSFTTLEKREEEYNIESEKLKKYQKLLDFVNFDVKKLNKYDDQTLIKDAVIAINGTIKDYDAACYLLDSDDENVALLPQYRNSKAYLETIMNYLKGMRDKLNNSVLELESECANMKLSKKYFEILSEENPFVKDIDEFIYLLDRESLDLKDRNMIVSYIIKSNVSNYKNNN